MSLISATIDWGDGTSNNYNANDTALSADFTLATYIVAAGSTTAALDHTYSTPGTYTVTVTMTRNGVTFVDTQSVVVEENSGQDPPPFWPNYNLGEQFIGKDLAFVPAQAG